MIRVVYDTNVIVSGIANIDYPDRTTARLLELAVQEGLTLVSSGSIIREVDRALTKPYFRQRINAVETAAMLAFLLEQSIGNNLAIAVQGIASHPEDDLILSTALSASADVLVTGDRMLLKLDGYEGIAIMSPSDFLAYLESQE